MLPVSQREQLSKGQENVNPALLLVDEAPLQSLVMAGYKGLSPHVGFRAGEWPLWLRTQPVAEERR